MKKEIFRNLEEALKQSVILAHEDLKEKNPTNEEILDLAKTYFMNSEMRTSQTCSYYVIKTTDKNTSEETIIDEKDVLPDGRGGLCCIRNGIGILPVEEKEKYITQPSWKAINNNVLQASTTLERMLDLSVIPLKEMEHKENEKLFVEACNHLFYNTNAFTIGDTLTTFRRWCQQVHYNTGDKSAKSAKSGISLYQYSAIGGTGKSELGKIACEALRKMGYNTDNNARIVGRWVGNDFSRNIVSVIDEFMPPKGTDRDITVERINNVIDNGLYEVEYKGRQKYTVKSISSLILNSNYLPFDTNARRYGIIRYNENNIQGYAKLPDFDEQVEWFILALTSVPYNKEWDNIIERRKDSFTDLVYMAKTVKEIDPMMLEMSPRDFAEKYKKASNDTRNAKVIADDIYRALLVNGIKPTKKTNQDDKYSKYDFLEIAETEMDQVSQTTDVDDIGDDIERTQKAFEIYYLNDDKPTDPNDDKPTSKTNEETIEVSENETEEPKQLSNSFFFQYLGEEPIEENKKEPIAEPVHSYSKAYTQFPTDFPNDEFETINPIKERMERKNENVVSMQNFLFEMDEMDMKEQAIMVKNLVKRGIVNRVVYSGGKSLHCRVTVEDKIENADEYRFIWKQLNIIYFNGKADPQCSNPARFTRKPEGFRIDKGKVQKLLDKNDNVIPITNLVVCYWANVEQQKKKMEEMQKRKYQFNNSDEEKILKNYYNKNRDKWQVAKDLVDGKDPGSGSNMVGAIAMLHKAGLEDLSYRAWDTARMFHPSNITKEYERYVR